MSSRESTPKSASRRSSNSVLTAGQGQTGRLTRLAGLSTIVEDLEDVKDAKAARKFLEKGLLLMPPGEPITHQSLSMCLHQILAITTLPKQVKNTVRAVAFLIDKMEEHTIHKAVRDAVNSHLNEFAADLSNFVENTKTSIDSHVDGRLKELSVATDKIANTAKAAADNYAKAASQPHLGGTMACSYSKALTQAPLHANPRLCQFMMEGCEKGSRMGKMNNTEMKAETGAEACKARSVTRQRNGGLLLEMETDAGAEWIRAERNGKALFEALGQGIHFKARSYNLIAYNSPLEIDPGNPDHIQEICKVNSIADGQLMAMRRSNTQRSAHLILTFTDVDAANRTLIKGLAVCHRKLRVKKCLKCQGWNHFAKECTSAMYICGTCAEQGQRTSKCPSPKKHRRECPTFRRKQVDCNNANPKNSLPFIPLRDAWSWAPETKTAGRTAPMHWQPLPQTFAPADRTQRERRE
ncbi:hypothetical protein B0H34DRAFT_817929 [Crassisporium funariophilum]|nr:hypothetical protein B0H34DRAFT_817929 [Crassisporium funariophilum]